MDAAAIIDRFGGTVAVAKLFDIRPPSVSDWKKNGIPKARLMYLQVIRPEFFDDRVDADLEERSAA